MNRHKRAKRTTKRQRKDAARGHVAPVRTRQGTMFIVDEPEEIRRALDREAREG